MKHQIVSDARTVWINSGKTGHCLGRFSRWGIDVHAEIDPSSSSDAKDCIECTHVLPCYSDWQRFVAAMQEHHGVTVEEKHQPKWLIREWAPMAFEIPLHLPGTAVSIQYDPPGPPRMAVNGKQVPLERVVSDDGSDVWKRSYPTTPSTSSQKRSKLPRKV